MVAKLPFEPFALLRGISHRNLMGSDFTDCSFIFLYILCTMSIREVRPRGGFSLKPIPNLVPRPRGEGSVTFSQFLRFKGNPKNRLNVTRLAPLRQSLVTRPCLPSYKSSAGPGMMLAHCSFFFQQNVQKLLGFGPSRSVNKIGGGFLPAAPSK